jgi:hypothetical protein
MADRTSARSTIGSGDTIPLSLQARCAAVTESRTEQFYLAILVARLVEIQSVIQPAPFKTVGSRSAE